MKKEHQHDQINIFNEKDLSLDIIANKDLI